MMEFLREFVSTLPAMLGYGGTVMLLGMLIVFIGLIILILCIRCLSILLSIKKEQAPKQEASVVVPAPIAQAAAAQTGDSADELIAVITAALMAYAADEQAAGGSASGKKLVVRNIRAIAAQQNAWARAGRVNQINNRF